MHEHDWTFLGALDRPDPRASRLDCEKPQVLACRGCGDTAVIRCMTSSAKKCTPCSARYRSRVGRVARSGMVVSPGREFFVTLTAPGTVPHRLPGGRWCPCTPVGVGGEEHQRRSRLASWNGSASKRFNRFLQDLRRSYPRKRFPDMWRAVVTVSADGRERTRWVSKLEYFRAAEVQRRGALHYHLAVRGPAGVSTSLVRSLALKHGFGHEVDVQVLTGNHANYLAKYVSKSSDERPEVPWRGVRLRQHVMADGSVVRTARMSWKATYRTWSASRDWGLTMAWVKAAQGHYAAVVDDLPAWSAVALGPSWAEGAPRRPDARLLAAAVAVSR